MRERWTYVDFLLERGLGCDDLGQRLGLPLELLQQGLGLLHPPEALNDGDLTVGLLVALPLQLAPNGGLDGRGRLLPPQRTQYSAHAENRINTIYNFF